MGEECYVTRLVARRLINVVAVGAGIEEEIYWGCK